MTESLSYFTLDSSAHTSARSWLLTRSSFGVFDEIRLDDRRNASEAGAHAHSSSSEDDL